MGWYLGMKFNASNGAYEGLIFDTAAPSFGIGRWWLVGWAEETLETSGLSLGAQFRADTNHYYALCFYCIARAQGEGYQIAYSSGGSSEIRANIPWMRWDRLG